MKQLKDMITITLGTLIVAVGVYFFKFPNNFCTGGVSGIAVILGHLYPGISTGQFNLIINGLLLVLGLFTLGRSFGGKTVYCSLLLSLSINVMEKLFPLTAPMTNQPLLELFYAVFIPSVGSAVLFYTSASTGGTDIIAMILKKYSNLNIGNALLVSDALIVVSAAIVFGPQTGLFSLLGLLSKSFVVNGVTSFLTVSKNSITIVDKEKVKEVCEYITKDLKRGATVIDCQGYYTHKDKAAIISVLRKTQVNPLREYIKQVDPHAFVIVTDTNQAYGKGFNTI